MPAVRVRISPSPTGWFHLGSARTSLFNWLFARQNGGTFILRIEDTDLMRNRAEHTEGICAALRWLGLDWDEGPYFQSQRGDLYQAAVERLLVDRRAYACDCAAEETAARAAAAGRAGGYDGYCRDRDVVPGPGTVVRFRTPDVGQTRFADVVRGDVTVDNANIEDFALRRSDGSALFLLANVVDDADMAISHVIRGEDHITNTSKYVLLWEALGFGEVPVFAHLPLLHNQSHQKLSKRRDRVAVEDYRDDGYLPEAMVNYLALLGWSPGGDREILTREEMVASFRLEDVKKSPAVFDERKLASIDAEYIRGMPVEELVARTGQWIADRWSPLAGAVAERARTMAEAVAMVDFLVLPFPCVDAVAWDAAVTAQPAFGLVLSLALERYTALVDWDASSLRAATLAAGEAAGVAQLGKAQAPVRLAVTGRSVGPPLFESMAALGRPRTLARMASALERLPGTSGSLASSGG